MWLETATRLRTALHQSVPDPAPKLPSCTYLLGVLVPVGSDYT